MGKSLRRDYIKKIKPYFILFFITLFSYLLFRFAHKMQYGFQNLVSVASYLTWHNIFELFSIFVSFSIFFVVYFSLKSRRELRLLIIGNMFLAVGIIDLFHTLSYKGMPDFFIPNFESNRATTFWILARLIAAVGFVLMSIIPVKRETKINRNVMLILIVTMSFLCFYLVTYKPGIFPQMYIEGEGLTAIKITLERFVIALLAVSLVIFFVKYIKNKDYLYLLSAGAMILSIFSEAAFMTYFQVNDIYNYIGHVYKVIAYFLLFRIVFVRGVRQPYIELYEAQEELRLNKENLDNIVEERTAQLSKANKMLTDDMDYARDIQKAMLPSSFPKIAGFKFSAMYHPAERISGDFYDIFRLDDEHIVFYICDVSGHGVPAAMLTVFLKQSIDERRKADFNAGEVTYPANVLKGLYDAFNASNFREDVYIVLIYVIYNIKTKRLTYSSAGMNAKPFLIKNDGTVANIPIYGLPICKLKDIFEPKYYDNHIDMNPGDKLVFYTDGFVDAKNKSNESYSVERLKKLLEDSFHLSGEKLLEAAQNDLFKFIDGEQALDDITFTVLDFFK